MITMDFNSRTHAGATIDTQMQTALNGISTHAPMRVRPVLDYYVILTMKNFNSRTHAGAT